MSATLEEVFNAMVEMGFPANAITVEDNAISLPDADFVSRLGRSVESFLLKNNIHFEDEDFDCDDFARTAEFIAKISHTKLGNKGTGIGFGRAKVAIGLEPHLVNVSFRHVNGRVVGALYEPQKLNGLCLREQPASYFSALLGAWV